MNKGIASGYAISKQHALEELHKINGLDNHHLYFACLGELYLDMKEPYKAKEQFEKALHLTTSIAEKQFLAEKIRLCGD